ncbi:DUF6985 domain-containing protein [Lysobacter sp. CA199]|uniref:DUF6985 domain-containing protein n=1 Tax=Lysobacter sp. CA199 TaxID=3455608 RepID=UPI003F8D84FD
MPSRSSNDAATLFEARCSQPLALSILGGHECELVPEGYDEDEAPEDFHAAVEAFIASPHAVLLAASDAVHAYYRDINAHFKPGDPAYLQIATPAEVWRHVQLGFEAMVERRAHGDGGVYISLECNCDWEPEHGLQIVFKGGRQVSKVGPYDGHLSNADAYADERLEHLVYRAQS